MMSTTMGVSAGLRLKKFVGGIRFLLPLSLILFYSLSPITCPLLRAQTETATLSGIIQDPKGGVVPGVEVVLTRVETGTVGTTTTNGAGIYVFTGLEPGHFRLLVRKEGFKEISIKEFELHVQDKLEQNFSLEIGSISERVTVEGNGLVINTTDATVATTIDRDFVENLPLNGRSFQTLILLTPGTVLVGGNNDGGTFSVNGQRTNSNNFTVDGVSANLGGALIGGSGANVANGANPNFTTAGTTQGMVSVDALQEFKIQTSTYAPEFGRQPGGQVSLLTRSGTNAFHGTAFDYLRNTVFDANNWFNNAASPQIPRGAERQNDFGGTFGGPIFKDKTFFFFSYEGLRLLVPSTQNYTVPSLQLRQQAAPAFQPILNSFPIPNGPISGDGAILTLNASQPSHLDTYAIKIDHTFGGRIRLFGRYADTKSNNQFITIGGVPLTQLTSRSVTIGTDFVVSPTLNNELRLNYTVNSSIETFQQLPIGGGKLYDTAILHPAPFAPDAFNNLAVSLPDAFFNAGSGSFSKESQRQINVVDNFSYARGSHHLKWGVDYRRLFPILGFIPGGSAAFDVNSLSDLMAGTVSQSFAFDNAVGHPIYTNFSAYAQDTWKLSNRLTLTYGLRWDLNPTPGERDGLDKFLLNVIGLDNPATATLAPAGSRVYTTTYNNFAPRLGLAYQVRQTPGRETVVRGGFGVFYDLNSETFAQEFDSAIFNNAAAPVNNLPFPIPNNALPIPPVPILQTPPYSNISGIDPNLELPLTLQWNLSIEQGLGQNQSLSASYVAARGLRLLRSDQLFNFSPQFAQVNVLRNASSSNYQSLQLQFNRRLSRGLRSLLSYTYSHSIDNASDGQTVYSTAVGGTSVLNPDVDRGNSNFDVRHSFRGAVTYDLPGWNANILSKAILSGWSIDALEIAQSGLPVNLLVGRPYRTNGQRVRLRPNLVPGQPLYLDGSACTASNGGVPCPGGRGFNPAAFERVPTDASGNPTQLQGNLGRNVLRGFGAVQTDFAVHRQFNFTEKVNLQFRSEFFNVFNHPNFSCINSFVGFGSFGVAQCTLNNSSGGLNSLYTPGGPRSVQLALKLSF